MANAIQKEFKSKKRIVFLIVGNANDEYGEKVNKLFGKSENRVIRFPTQRYTDLPRFYQASDLSIFPKQVSLSFYDAQATGLLVLSEQNNINADRLKFDNGLIFESNNKNDFRTKIVRFAEMTNLKYQKMSDNAMNFVKNNYDYDKIAREYTSIFE